MKNLILVSNEQVSFLIFLTWEDIDLYLFFVLQILQESTLDPHILQSIKWKKRADSYFELRFFFSPTLKIYHHKG